MVFQGQTTMWDLFLENRGLALNDLFEEIFILKTDFFIPEKPPNMQFQAYGLKLRFLVKSSRRPLKYYPNKSLWSKYIFRTCIPPYNLFQCQKTTLKF